MRAKTRRTESRKARTQRRRQLVRRVVYVLNLLLGVAANGCELAAFGGHWLAPDTHAAPIVRTEREFADTWPVNISREPSRAPSVSPADEDRELVLSGGRKGKFD